MNVCATGVMSEMTYAKSGYITSVNVMFAEYEYTVGGSDTEGRSTLQQYSCILATDTPEILTCQHLRKIVPRLEVSPLITSSTCTDSMTLHCISRTIEPVELL
jgi:hypothetical protein